MKKQDFILIGIVLGIAIILLGSMLIYNMVKKEEKVSAEIYYDGTLLITIELNTNRYSINYTHPNAKDIDLTKQIDGIYIVPGAIAKVEIEVDTIIASIRVEKEESPKHYCSLQGWSNSQLKPITCLPNNLYIKILNSSETDLEFVQ